MYQNILQGSSNTQVIVCGQKGGLPYQNITRPFNADGDCPDNYGKCSASTSPDNTICYPTSALASSCPITDILVVETSGIATYTDLGYTDRTFNGTASIVYSKDTDSLPLTSIKLEATIPCIDPYDQSESSSQKFYKAEMASSGCKKNSFLETKQDIRYKATGLHTNVW